MRIPACSSFVIAAFMMAASQIAGSAQQPESSPAAAASRPDLTGMWQRAAGPAGNRAFGGGRNEESEGGGLTTNLLVRDGNMNYLEIDAEFIAKMGQQMPQYKPEYWEVVHDLEEHAYRRPADPSYGCKNPGVVRLERPVEIVQLPNKVLFLYTGEHIWVREIPTDGRPLPTEDEYEGTKITGASVGRWEGDVLVVETVDFAPELVWYSTRGWPASFDAKITERLQRKGDQIEYNLVVDDPAFIRPWVWPTLYMDLNKNPAAILQQPLPCIERDAEHMPPSSR